jgi:HTH-type transcriptional regulator / antitoxin HipB
MQPMKSLPLQTPAQLADHLRSFRKARGLTQAQLGRLVGIDQTRVTRIEKNPDRVSVYTLLKMLAALRVRVLLQPLDPSKPADNGNAGW